MFVSGVYKLVVGCFVYDFYMKKWVGVDLENGDLLWYKNVKDVNNKIIGCMIINDYVQVDYYYIGKLFLFKVYGGFNIVFLYKGFELLIIFVYSIGNYIVDCDVIMLWYNGSFIGCVWLIEILNCWILEN